MLQLTTIIIIQTVFSCSRFCSIAVGQDAYLEVETVGFESAKNPNTSGQVCLPYLGAWVDRISASRY